VERGSAAKGTDGKDAADVGKVKTPFKEKNTPVTKPAAGRPPRGVFFLLVQVQQQAPVQQGQRSVV
jgi:hypothetical protein